MFFCFWPGRAQGCPKPKGPRKPVLRFPAPGGPVGQNTKCNVTKCNTKFAQFQGETFGADGFPPKSAPSSGKLCFSVFGPQFPSAKGYRRPKRPKNPVFCDSPPLGVWSAKTQNVKKLRNFGEKFLGRTYFFPLVPLALGNYVFPFLARNLSKCQGLPLSKRALKPSILRFPALGGPVGENTKCKKVAQFFGRTDFPPQKCP